MRKKMLSVMVTDYIREHNRSSLLFAGLFLTAFSINAQTIDTPDAASNRVKELDSVQVKAAPISEQLMDEQRENISVTNIVSGDSLRQQPEVNLANLLTRLPGISASVDQSRNQASTGESQYITIRGFDTSYNAYSLNGVRLAQTDSNSRAVSMNLLSPFGLGSVVVNKAPGADQDGDAIAGSIDLRTSNAFELQGPKTTIRTQVQAADRALDRNQPGMGYTLQGETRQLFGENEQFGVYFNAYYQTKDNVGESIGMQRDAEIYDKNIPGTIRDNPDNIYSRGVQWNIYRNNVERYGGNLNLSFRGENTRLFLETMFGQYNLESAQDQSSIRQELVTGANNPFQEKLREGLGFAENPNGDGGNYTSDGLRREYGMMGAQYQRREDSKQSLFSVRAGGTTIIDDLTWDYSAAYSKGKQTYPMRLESAFYGWPYIGTENQAGLAQEPIFTDISNNRRPSVILSSDAANYLNNLSNMKQWNISYSSEEVEEKKSEIRSDIAYEVSPVITLKAGFKYEDTDRRSNKIANDDENRYYVEVQPDGSYKNNPNRPFWGPGGLSAKDFKGSTLNGFMGGNPQVPIKLMDKDELERMAKELSGSIPLDPNVYTQNLVIGQEKRTGMYVMTTLNLNNLTLVPGMRYEQNSFNATYYQNDDGDLKQVNSSRDYSQWLPSVLATYRPNEKTVIRGSIRKGYARPAFDQLVGITDIERDTDGSIIGISQPNPDLKPVTSMNFDLGVEFYADNGAFMQLSTYYKKLKDVIYATGSTNAGSDFNNFDNPNFINGIEVSSLANGEDGKAYGVELGGRYQFTQLPAYWSGLGVQSNMTFQRTEGTIVLPVDGELEYRKTRLPKAPNQLFNFDLFYNWGGFDTALSYQRQGNSFSEVRGSRPDVYLQPTQKLNLTANYDFKNGVKVGLAIENLLNDYAYWATYGEGKKVLSSDRRGGYVETGRVFQLNATYSF